VNAVAGITFHPIDATSDSLKHQSDSGTARRCNVPILRARGAHDAALQQLRTGGGDIAALGRQEPCRR
jgi:hypothetical protein